MINVQALVEAHLYPTPEAAIKDALRALLRDKPQLRVELAIHQYRSEGISLAKAAYLAGVSFDHMKALLIERNIQPRLGPGDPTEAQAEVTAMEKIIGNQGVS